MEIHVEHNGKTCAIPYTLEEKLRFEKRYGGGSFERLYRLLASNPNSFQKVGEVFGLSRQRIHQIYTKRLARFLGASGTKRRRNFHIANLHKVSLLSPALDVWRMAEQQGLRVEFFDYETSNGRIRTAGDILRISGKICKIRGLKKANYRRGITPYAHTSAVLKELEL